MPSPPLSIVQSLSPRIAVLTSADVVESCEANGCRGLEELLRPWEGGTERVSILSSTLIPGIHPTFPLRFVSYSSIFPNPGNSSPNADVVVDLISSFVGSKKPDDELHYPFTRSLLLSSRPLAAHETFNHPVGVLLAVSTATPDPLGTLGKMYQQTMTVSGQSVPWMDGVNVMRFYVVVHDVNRMGEDLEPAHELLANVKKAHGPHSTLLVINSQIERRSAPPSPDTVTHPTIPLPRPFSPDEANPSALSQVYASALSSLTLSPMSATQAPIDGVVADSPRKPARRKLYGSKLTAEDTQRLAALVRELVVQSVVPWMEARIREWNEIYHSNRRGITGRLFGAGRKLFTSRPNSPSPNSTQGYDPAKGYYRVTAIEALSRRLADFAFMLRDYKFASSVYDSLRRDFAQDGAWRYSAAATEMYGLSLLLSHTFFLPSSPPKQPSNPFTTLQHTDISSWLEQAVHAYHSRAQASQIQLDAMRATILYYEAWKAIGEWRSVGVALVKSAGEADEVPSAVMIEEAAAADVKGGKSEKGRRKRAFHLVMAARRYETAGLKTYSRRCLERASQIYRAAPWTAAQDRIEYSLGRQAYTLGESDVAVEHFLRLLRREDTGVPGSQGMVLEDMALAYEQLVSHPELLSASSEKLHLPTPIFNPKHTRIVSSAASSSGTSERWSALEEVALSTWDRKGKRPLRLLPDDKRIIISVNEPCQVELLATNPINSPVDLGNLTITTDNSDLTVEVIPEIMLDPYETRVIPITISSSKPATFSLQSVTFQFHKFFPCSQSLEKRGKRLHKTKLQRLTPTYEKDMSLVVSVVEARPAISVQLIGVPETLFQGERVDCSIQITNTGAVPVHELQLISDDLGMISLKSDTSHSDTQASIPNNIASPKPLNLISSIEPGSTASVPILFTGTKVGRTEYIGLVIFANEDQEDVVAVQVAKEVEVEPLLSATAVVRPSKLEDGCLVTVEISNTSPSSVEIGQLQTFSSYWTVNGGADKTTLHPNQTVRSVLHVAPSTTKEDLKQSEMVSHLAKLLQHQPDHLGTPNHPPVTFPSSCNNSSPFLIARQQYRLDSLQANFPTLSIDQIRRIFPLFDPLDLDISIPFSIPGTSRSGHAFMHSIRPAPEFSIVDSVQHQVDAALASGSKQTRTMYEETGRLRRMLMDSVLEGVLAREDDPVSVRVKVGGKKVRGGVVVDLSKGSSSIPVQFELVNRSPLLPVRWVLRLPPPEPVQSSTSQPPSASFTGQLVHLGTLPPQSSHTVTSTIWITEPGLFSLSDWDLDVETGDEMDGVWRPRMSWSRKGERGVVQVVQE